MKLILNIVNANDINKIPHIRELIVLCYIVNANNSMRDQYLRTSQLPETPASIRDNIYAVIQLSSLTFESMIKVDSIFKKISDIIPKELHSEIAWLNNEIKSPKSFCNSVLKSIRDELGFHFSHCLANIPLQKSIPHIPPVLAEGGDQSESELVYILPTDILSSYLISLTSEPTNDAERLEWIISELGSYNNRVSSVHREMVYSIITKIEPSLIFK